MKAARPIGLTQQNALLLIGAFLVFELLVVVVTAYFVMLPLARRSTADLAGLMTLSAQTWSELPPVTRPAFEIELARSHALALRAEPPLDPAPPSWRDPYLRFLLLSLAERTGVPVTGSRETIGGEDWFWVALPAGGGYLSVGFPHSRIASRPLQALLASLTGGFALALAAAWWLAGRTTRPLELLREAVDSLGRGQTPARLPETGPREIAALSRRFNAMAKEVEELLAARTVLLAGVSHDLRTPLARLRLAVEMLVRRPSAELAAQIEADIEAMDRLIGDVLTLARGFGHEPAARVDLAGLLAELAATAPDRVTLSADTIEIEVPPGALRRVLGNLLDNALRHGGDAPVALRAETEPDGGVRIGVLDRGPGIPLAEREAVFRPFHRLDASRNLAAGGSGLGLAIVRQLAVAHGWRVRLEDRAGGGLAAWLEIDPRGAAATAT
ncbi:MAG: hypothetical protein BGP21_09735 [Thiobacillus sp. 65-29]|nr:MAG: hypothetical protein BGP21_09735 [Thiobacillus sp. 65-29]